MKRLHILCGLSFSGKTTGARKLRQAIACVNISLDEINAERGLYGGDGLAPDEWKRSQEIALQRMAVAMTEGQDIILDDTCCFRWLRDRYRDHALRNGYSVQLAYLDVAAEEIQRRIAENRSVAQRQAIAPEVLGEHLRTFEKPSVDEGAVVLNSSQSIAGWISSLDEQDAE